MEGRTDGWGPSFALEGSIRPRRAPTLPLDDRRNMGGWSLLFYGGGRE